MNQRTRGDHLRVKQRVPTEQPGQIAKVGGGPVHHGRHAEAAGENRGVARTSSGSHEQPLSIINFNAAHDYTISIGSIAQIKGRLSTDGLRSIGLLCSNNKRKTAFGAAINVGADLVMRMQPPERSENETERLAALELTGLLDTLPEERFDRITRIARSMFGVDIALVSLVSADEQWFKSRQGLDACSTSRDISFCGHAILGADVFVVPDTARDARFADNPLVTGAPHIRFYAGAPLKTGDGFRIGTLCIMDSEPRIFQDADRCALRDLADLVEREIQQVVTQDQLVRAEIAERRLASVIEGTNIGTWEWNVQTGETVFNQRSAAIVGYALEELAPIIIDTWIGLAHPEDLELSERALEAHFNGEVEFYDVVCRMRHKAGHWVWVHDRGRLVSRTPDGAPLLMAGTHADVTERMSEKQALEVSEQKFRSLVDNIPGTTYRCLLDEHWTMLHMSEQVDPLSGYPASDFINNQVRSYQSIIHPEDRDANDEAVATAIAQGESWLIECRILHKDGTIRWAQERGSPVYGHQGEIEYLDGFLLDITAEKQLRVERQRQLDAFAILNEIASNPSLTVVEQTQRALELGTEFLGMEIGILSRIERQRFQIRALVAPGEIGLRRGQEFNLGDTCCALVVESDDLVDNHCMRLAPGSRHPGSQHFAVEAYMGIPVHVADGLYGTLGFSSRKPRHEPFTESERLFMRLLGRWGAASIERHRSLRALRQSEARLRSLFELSPIGIALNDFETGAFIETNPALLAPTGYSAEEFARLSYWQLTPQEYEVRELEQINSMNETGRYGPYEKEYMRKDGSRYPVLLNGIVVDDNDGRKLIWSIVEDISERKRIERLQNEFIATVSHELRTPLTAIAGALGLLRSEATGQLPDAAREMVGVADKNCQRLLLLISDLLDMEKLLAGKLSFEIEEQPLLPLIEESLTHHDAYARQFDVELIAEWGPGVEGCRIAIDAHRMQQIMANLLSNAIKFSPKGAPVMVTITALGDRIRISIIDRGPGIPVEFRERIFQKFAQADASDSRQKGGTGLGLAITRELTERMGGEAGFESEPGVGAEFFVDFPRVDGATEV